MRRIAAVLALVIAALSVLFVIPARIALAQNHADQKFQALSARFVADQFRVHPEHATQIGEHRYDDRLSDLSERGISNRAANARRWQTAMASVNEQELSPPQRADLEWLRASIDSELLDYEEIKSWRKNPDIYLPTGAIYGLIKRDFAPLPQRMRTVTARERAAIANLRAARANLRPSEVPAPAVEIALQQMPATVSFYKTALPEAFASIPEDDPDKQEFIDANRRLTTAIESYGRWIESTLKPGAKGNFAIGEHAFARMLTDHHMVDLDLEELEAVGEDELSRLQTDFAEVAAQIDSGKRPQEVFHEMARNHPPAADVLATAAAGLDGLRQFVIDNHLATIASELRPIVKETPPYRRATTFASMDTAGPLEKTATESYFYITLPDPAWPAKRQEQLLDFYSPPSLSDVSVHEVFPGHYVQFIDNRQNPDLVRKVFGSGSNFEGWGLYCEQMVLDEGLHQGEPRFRLAQLQMALQRAARYLVAIRLHTRGMTVDEAQTFFEDNAYLSPVSARMEALRGTEDPDYLEYQLGKLMILKLRDDIQQGEGTAFDIGRFHDAFLSQGPLPIKLIRRALLGEDGPLL